ncbi:DUF6318 family protein [Geodermatophilus sp. SYSU D00815]
MRRRWTLRFLTGLALSAVLVSGCSSKQEANDTLPTAEETTSSPTLEPLGPPDFPVPEEAREESDEGARLAAEYFLALTGYAIDNLESSPLRELSHDCAYCSNLAQTIESEAAAGHRFVGGEVLVGSDAQVSRTGPSAEVYLGVRQSALDVIDASGQSVPGRAQPEFDVSASVLLHWNKATRSWIVTQVAVS